MDEQQIIYMLGQHDTRLESIERVTTQTATDVRSIMSALDQQKGARSAHEPIKLWVARTSSAIAAAILGGFVALRFGLHK